MIYMYLQDGVNWLAFLNKYKLHGILCDDMGLGKTLQSICIMAGDHHVRQKKYKVCVEELFSVHNNREVSCLGQNTYTRECIH